MLVTWTEFVLDRDLDFVDPLTIPRLSPSTCSYESKWSRCGNVPVKAIVSSPTSNARTSALACLLIFMGFGFVVGRPNVDGVGSWLGLSAEPLVGQDVFATKQCFRSLSAVLGGWQ